jgi:glutamine amidotransferase
VPTDICFSFTGFRQRGGRTDQHSDGWGIAFFEGRGCRVFLDPAPAVASPVADLVRNFPIRSTNVIAHIRKATHGAVGLENTHPFMRELWGRYWIFAHNGTLNGLAPRLRGDFLPVGSTDSERAFCVILQALRHAFPEGEPDTETLVDLLGLITRDLAALGTFNYLLSNGRYLFAHCADRLQYIVRQAPFSTAHLLDDDVEVDFSELTTPQDRVAVIATQPLTDNEQWTALSAGELAVFQDGARIG